MILCNPAVNASSRLEKTRPASEGTLSIRSKLGAPMAKAPTAKHVFFLQDSGKDDRNVKELFG
jgi:hypothetical protein